jgi:hypothetical protein
MYDARRCAKLEMDLNFANRAGLVGSFVNRGGCAELADQNGALVSSAGECTAR